MVCRHINRLQEGFIWDKYSTTILLYARYRANGYLSEPYLNSEDPACLIYPTLIFSKPLADEPMVLWKSRSIHLTEQIEKQRRYCDSELV